VIHTGLTAIEPPRILGSMGLVHFRATLQPSKQQLCEGWRPSRSWAAGATHVDKLAEYRFDDPEGEVGVETILWRTTDGTVLQVPFTYRAAPLAGAEDFLIGTSDHSVLGRRWVYDGCGDPVWAATLATAILTGGTQAQMMIENDGELVDVPARVQVRGSGSADAAVPEIVWVDSVDDTGLVSTVTAGSVTVLLPRVLGTPVEGSETLTGHTEEIDLGVLAALR
jgi:Maltokinase N-terminal cap domain